MKPIRSLPGIRALAFVLCLSATSATARAQFEVDDLLQEIQADIDQGDLARIANSTLGVLRFWNGVDSEGGSRRRKPVPPDEVESWGWRFDLRSEKMTKIPGKEIPISNMLAVPEDGNYRIWLRHAADLFHAYPVELSITGANQFEHVFGHYTLTTDSARNQEEAQPIRFENTAIRCTAPRSECQVWEYWDVDLKKGDSLFQLSADRKEAKFSHIFISASKSFTPRLPMQQYEHMPCQVEYEDSTLLRVYYRFRVTEGDVARYQFRSTSLKYHWFFDPKKETYDGIWGVGMGQTALHNGDRLLPLSASGQPDIPCGEWTDWLDATWASQGSGPWSTGVLQFNGLERGKCQIELAWYPHPSAVVGSITTEIDGGVAKFIAPLCAGGRARIVLPDNENGTGVWGVVAEKGFDWFKNLDFFHERYAAWVEEARQQLGITVEPRIPHGIKFIAGINGNRAEQRACAKILVSMGFNTLSRVPRDICEEVGAEAWLTASAGGATCDPADPAHPVLVKQSLEGLLKEGLQEDPDYAKRLRIFNVGDEIGVIAGTYKINQGVDSLKRFRHYLATVLKEKQQTPAFFGVESLDDLKLLGVLPTNPGLFERRLYRHTKIFKELITGIYYRPITETTTALFPNSLTYANYSPAPMRQGSQVHSLTWYSLLRQGALNLAWGEDWVHPGYSFTGPEIVTYYSAITECAARKQKCPAGFYNVVGGGCIPSDTSIMCSLSRNLKNLVLYTFGPSYNATSASPWEGCWSDQRHAYTEVVKVLYVADFVGRYLAEGRIEERKVAVLCNRDHEYMHGGYRAEQTDLALTFSALGSCNRNADLILNEDLTPGTLKQYSALFINGFCLPKAAVPALKQWVAEGGLLVAAANSAVSDEYDSPLPEMEEVFGARQFNLSVSTGYFTPTRLRYHVPIGKITVQETEFSPALTADVVGVRATLVPTTAQSIATFEDGTCAATLNKIGKGHVLLWGVQPGVIYKGEHANREHFPRQEGHYMDERLALFEKPLARVMGPSPLSTDAPQMELTRLELEDHTAILVNNFKKYAWTTNLPPMEVTIKLKSDQKVTSVSSAMHGELTWKREGDWLRVVSPVPSSVDSLLVQ